MKFGMMTHFDPLKSSDRQKFDLTSGYATWFTAGGAIRIAHYDVIDDVITRKLRERKTETTSPYEIVPQHPWTRSSSNTIPWAHSSPKPKRHLDRFSRFCMAH